MNILVYSFNDKIGDGLQKVTFLQTLKTGALTGARFDLLDKESQESNISGK